MVIYLFNRKVESVLNEYYSNSNDKIIVIDGARQIGKSYIIRNTASKHFSNYVEIDLKSDYEGEKLFENVKTTRSFYLLIGSLYDDRLNSLDETIIFLDEIQFYPHLITMLKDLKKESRYRYIASGSLLSVTNDIKAQSALDRGFERFSKYKNTWMIVDLDEIVNKLFKNPHCSNNGQKFEITDRDSKYIIYCDNSGSYFRIGNKEIPFTHKGHFVGLDLNSVLNETINGKISGTSKSRREELSHFRMKIKKKG